MKKSLSYGLILALLAFSKVQAHLVEKGLNATHFDAVMRHLSATLQELGVADDLIMKAAQIAESTRKDILG